LRYKKEKAIHEMDWKKETLSHSIVPAEVVSARSDSSSLTQSVFAQGEEDINIHGIGNGHVKIEITMNQQFAILFRDVTLVSEVKVKRLFLWHIYKRLLPFRSCLHISSINTRNWRWYHVDSQCMIVTAR
jgi:hypothetical protein